jgi:hypothetical protein
MLIEIKNRWDNSIIISGEYESIKDALQKNKGANLKGADLSSTYLSRADLKGADLSSADLSSADLRGADLRGAYLSSADLSRADLSSTDLRGADLRGADLSRANLSSADLSRAIGNHKNKIQPLQLLTEQPGFIRLYKLVTDDYISPMQSYNQLSYPIGETVEATANTDDTILCAEGINVATLDWCMKEWREGWRVLIVEFTAADIACIPIASDGKIRLHRCTVVGEKNLVEIGLIEKAKE